MSKILKTKPKAPTQGAKTVVIEMTHPNRKYRPIATNEPIPQIIKLRHNQEKIKPIPIGQSSYEKPAPVLVRASQPYAHIASSSWSNP